MDFDASLEIWKFFNQHSSITSTTKIVTPKEPNWINWMGTNPIQDELEWSTTIENEYSLTIYNLLGQPLMHQLFDASSITTLELNELPQGAYLAVYTTNNEVQTLKFIKA